MHCNIKKENIKNRQYPYLKLLYINISNTFGGLFSNTGAKTYYTVVNCLENNLEKSRKEQKKIMIP